MAATKEYMREYRKGRDREAQYLKRCDEIGGHAAYIESILVERYFYNGIPNTENDIVILEGMIEKDLRDQGFLKGVSDYKCYHPSKPSDPQV